VAEKETHSANTRTHLKIPGWHRNFILRPPRPAKGNGRLQKIARRLLAIHGTASTSDLISWAYRKPLWRKGERSKVQFNIAARYAHADDRRDRHRQGQDARQTMVVAAA
jgi:hypothetical protein